MLGSMAQEIPNPTAQDLNDVFFRDCSASSPSDSCPTVMGDGFGSIYKSLLLHTGSSNLCSKNPDNLPRKTVCVIDAPSVDEIISGGKRNVSKGLRFRRYLKNKEITIRVASCAISTIMALHTSVLLGNLPLFRNHLALFMFLAKELQKEHGFGSILIPMLELFSYMVLVSAVASIILLGAKFTRMHYVWFFSWSMLMIAESGNPIIALYLALNFFIVWCAVCSWERSNQMQGQKLSGTVELESSHDLHP